MDLLLRRMWPADQCVIGCLYIDRAFECYTLEDPERPEKIPGITAIPRGTYPVIIDWSPKFECLMPHILNVPEFDGIRIHPGNTSEDCEGCILVGQERGMDVLYHSRKAWDSLFCKLKAAEREKENITITIQGGE